MISETSTVKEAKDYMRPLLKSGVTCPCCARHTQMYSRTITSAMARGLIVLYRLRHSKQDANEFMHIENVLKEVQGLPASIRADIPKLRFWGLIEPDGKDNEETGNPNTGMYRITEQGKLFVEGKITVSKHVNIYNNRFFGYNPVTGTISIQEALKNKFNYEQLMKGDL